MAQMTFLDFFSGIGGFRKGFELCGMRCVGHCEIDKYADRSYRAIHNVKEDEWYAADITKVTPAELPRADLWAAGFPCQDISVSGRQRGINGARSGLFLRLLNSSKAKILKIDPHGLSLKMLRISCPFMEDGTLRPFSIRWPHSATISSTDFSIQKDFGPLKTENGSTLSLADILEPEVGPKIFPVPAGCGKALIQLIGGMQGQRVYDPSGISVTMAAQSGGWGGKTGLYFVDLCNGNPKLTNHARCIKAKYNSGITNRGGDNSGVFYGCRAVVTPEREEKRQNGRRIKECGEPAFTLTTQTATALSFRTVKNAPTVCVFGRPRSRVMRSPAVGTASIWRSLTAKTRRGRVGKGPRRYAGNLL